MLKFFSYLLNINNIVSKRLEQLWLIPAIPGGSGRRALVVCSLKICKPRVSAQGSIWGICELLWAGITTVWMAACPKSRQSTSLSLNAISFLWNRVQGLKKVWGVLHENTMFLPEKCGSYIKKNLDWLSFISEMIFVFYSSQLPWIQGSKVFWFLFCFFFLR
jgi:hypothetical protein